MTGIDYRVLTKKKAEKKLLRPLLQRAGRSNGRITMRHQGGGHKRKYRLVDFKRNKFDIPAKVAAIEYDPNRSAFIALLVYADGEKRYILAPEGLKTGSEIFSGEKTSLDIGNRLQLKYIPVGMQVHDIELQPGQGGKIVRSAGSFSTVLANEAGYTNIKLPSGEVRVVRDACRATIGQVSNPEHGTITIGKAGRSRWMGIRPTVRGSAMNPLRPPAWRRRRPRADWFEKRPENTLGQTGAGSKNQKEKEMVK